MPPRPIRSLEDHPLLSVHDCLLHPNITKYITHLPCLFHVIYFAKYKHQCLYLTYRTDSGSYERMNARVHVA
jgi:hypothetical protein